MAVNPIINDCLWWHTADTADSHPCLTSETLADVCIIGGGYSGLSTAIHLAEKGSKVCLLEAHRIGAGGSGRNVGYVNAGMWMKMSEVEAILGDKVGRKINQLLGDAPQLVFDLIDRFGIDAQATCTGNFQLAHNAQTEADIRDRHRQCVERGAPVELFSAKDSEALVGTNKICLALLDKRSGTINPYAYVTGLAKATQQRGVNLYENSPVIQLRKTHEQGKPQWQVQTADSCVFADKVVLATNAYTEGEWSDIVRSFFVVNYYQIASEPLDSDTAAAILPHRQGAADTRTVLSSMRRDKDNRLLLGTVGTHTGKPANFMPTWANRVADYYFPQLGKLNWQYQWSGKLGFSHDHLMRVFEPAEGLLAATAFNGRGITTGTLFGKAFADYLHSDNREDLPLPVSELSAHLQTFPRAKSLAYETGVTLYHAGQCLKVII